MRGDADNDTRARTLTASGFEQRNAASLPLRYAKRSVRDGPAGTR